MLQIDEDWPQSRVSDMSEQQSQQQNSMILGSFNPSVVPSVVVTGSQGIQIPAASLLAGQTQLSAQQLTALAAASGGAVFIPNLGGMRLPPLSSIPASCGPSISDMLLLAPGLPFPGVAAVQQPTPVASAAQLTTSYRDYSRASEGSSNSSKDHSFPAKLHSILSNPEHSDYITWLPHGRSWRVLKPKAFEEKVIPKCFRHAKYASFMRQVNGWGFRRMTQGPDHNSYYHELFLRGLPQLCQKMKRPSKTPHGMMSSGTHPDFYSMSLYAPLPDQAILPTAPSVTVSTSTVNFSGSDTSDRGVASNNSSETTSFPATSDSDCKGTGSDSDRLGGSSRDDSGAIYEGDRNINSRGSLDGRDDSNGSDRNSNSGYNEDLSGSDPSASDTERIIGPDGFELTSPRSTGRKMRSKKRGFIDRADSSIRGSDSSERSSIRDLNFLAASLLANKQGDVPTSIGVTPQDMGAFHVPTGTLGFGTAAGFPDVAAALSCSGQWNNGLPLAAPLTAANLSAANLSAANQLSTTGAATAQQQPSAPLTTSNLSYLYLQNQLIQSQATIAKLCSYQQRMGLPPMPATEELPPAVPGTQPNHEIEGGSN